MNEEDRVKLAQAKYIVWVDYYSDGWNPTPYETLAEALKHESYGSGKITTKPVIFRVEEIE
jgi:hypothetical protein